MFAFIDLYCLCNFNIDYLVTLQAIVLIKYFKSPHCWSETPQNYCLTDLELSINAQHSPIYYESDYYVRYFDILKKYQMIMYFDQIDVTTDWFDSTFQRIPKYLIKYSFLLIFWSVVIFTIIFQNISKEITNGFNILCP